jgi:beta-fructofuranosidase
MLMRVILAVSAVVTLIFLCGCTPKAGGDEADVMAIMDDYRSAFLAGDVDALLALYSEDWTDTHGSTKEDMKAGIKGMSEKGSHKGLEVDLSETEAVVDGDMATVTPVTLSSPEGSITYTHKLKKEADGVWRLVRTDTLSWEAFEMSAEERKLKTEHDAAALAARDLRERLLSDPHRPGYHFVMPEGIANPFDPNGAIYWKGRYHLFYIFQDTRSGTKLDHWGHVSSTDLFHWRHHPTDLLDGMYSGNCFVNADGVPTICYHQRGQGNAMAVALDDDLNEWKKLDTNPITPDTREGDEHHGKYRSWDPYGWFEGDTYYAIFGGERPGVVKSPTLGGEWRYVGDLFAHGVDGVSLEEDVSCPDLFKLGDKDVLLCISHDLGCRYYVGEWKNEQFYPESHEQMSWVDHSFFAPESLIDDQGRRIMWAWILDAPRWGVSWEHGWSGTLSLPRVLSLGDDGQLRIDVPEEIEALRYGAFKREGFALQSGADVLIDDIRGNSLELFIDMESAEASDYGVKVCVSPDGQEETSIYYDAADGTLKVDTRKSGPEHPSRALEAAPFKLKKGERLELRVFVDKSVVEVFANSRQAIARRIYPSRADSIGVSLFATGGKTRVHTLEAWKIMPSNPY